MNRIRRNWIAALQRCQIVGIAALLALVFIPGPIHAGSINQYGNGPWIMFGFGAVGTFAFGCQGFCFPFGNGVQADEPPWTFEAGARGATITVVDAFFTGDRFAVLDHGVPIGSTSEVPFGSSCGAVADDCLNGTNVSGGNPDNVKGSSGAFPVPPGQHSVTIQVNNSPFGVGAAYFRIDGEVGVPPPPPDTDGDGLPDDQDACPVSDRSSTVVVGDCDSAVPNTWFADGCTIADSLQVCGNGVRNHGMEVSCVARFLDGLRRGGTITGGQQGAIQSCVGRTN